MQLGLFSISYGGLWGQATLELTAFIRRAAELGYDAVMLAGKRPHLSPLDADDRVVASLKDELQSARIRCTVVAAYTDLNPAAAAEVPFLEMQISYVEALARLGSLLGAKYVRVFTAYAMPGISPHLAWQRVVGTIREICDRAASHGMTIAIQNHHDLAVHTTALLELLNDIDRPNCKLGFDAWSPALRGEDLYESARVAAPHTEITTNADYIRLPQYRYRPELVNYEAVGPDLVRAVPFGTGLID
ncbi:MAG TPA: sugar phosphate isomerase/epimerase family protein, partial [Gemmata sp.]|nr:sugar phosphate isomerase/epimerase family protein [Gemmata sp.]